MLNGKEGQPGGVWAKDAKFQITLISHIMNLSNNFGLLHHKIHTDTPASVWITFCHGLHTTVNSGIQTDGMTFRMQLQCHCVCLWTLTTHLSVAVPA